MYMLVELIQNYGKIFGGPLFLDVSQKNGKVGGTKQLTMMPMISLFDQRGPWPFSQGCEMYNQYQQSPPGHRTRSLGGSVCVGVWSTA